LKKDEQYRAGIRPIVAQRQTSPKAATAWPAHETSAAWHTRARSPLCRRAPIGAAATRARRRVTLAGESTDRERPSRQARRDTMRLTDEVADGEGVKEAVVTALDEASVAGDGGGDVR
jgi:hypothetical protein